MARRPTTVLVSGLVVLMVLLFPQFSSAADYPNKPINMIVPYAPGGSSDVAARAVAKVAGKYIPQPVVVVNQPGGAGITGRIQTVKAAPDGYTIMFGYGSGEDLVTPHTRKLPYDQFKDLSPVCQITVVSIILVVPSGNPAKNLKEFITWAKAQNRPINGAVSTRGASVDITMQALLKVAGINGQTIPFRGGAEAATAILGGNTDFSGQVYSEVMTHVKAGRLKVLAVGTRDRDPVIPDIPTFLEEGVNVWTFGAIRGIGAPKGTPDAIIDYLEAGFKKTTEDPEFHQIMKDIVHPVLFKERKGFMKNMQDGFGMYGQLIRELNLKLE
ncbi:MAG TPA: tripartite tricarboxylate transporter substrate binding protein [Candidatus Sulfotelmatobacter sp.]|nr:tripartite tricarboxylate transporter substrate binding protein [Candidatus Sulfotelmatobacter sp.]